MQGYIVIEIQTNAEGSIATLATNYSDYWQAQQKYHTVLAAAAASGLPVHSAVIMTPIGNVIERQGYNRTVEAQEQAGAGVI